MLKRILNIILLTLILVPVTAQELNCTVTINTQKIEVTTPEIFETLKQSMTEYMNDQKWTSAQVLANERIDCVLYLTVNSYQDDRLSCDLQIQVSRPVYNSTYTTTTLNFKDSNVEFNYQEYDQLIFNENTYESNLTCILNFYAYLILGLDFDTFSYKGGTSLFEQAEKYALMGQSAQETGWNSFESKRNRGSVIKDILAENQSAYRDILYTYHRDGLDQMALSMEKGRKAITDCINKIPTIYETNSMSVLLSLFSDAKLNELVDIYSEAPTSERDEVYAILLKIYPTSRKTLKELKDGKKK